MTIGPFVERLLREGDASTRYKLSLAGLGGASGNLGREIRSSPRAVALLAERDRTGRIPLHPYSKWSGAHWVLATLADLGYPPGDRSLFPLRDQVLDWLLDERRLSTRYATDEPYLGPILEIRGRTRIHASLEGNAIYALLALGLADRRVDALADTLGRTQWPDGGWNCDRTPSASCSSFEETLIPLRGLVWHARKRGNQSSWTSVRRAAEFLLQRRLFKRQSSGATIAPDFLKLHYPCYWHYDILFALKVMVEGGFIGDLRCEDAIARLRSKQRPDGGFPAEEKFWAGRGSKSRRTLVTWGPSGKSRSNEFVTADALWVLHQASEVRARSRGRPRSP